MVCALNSCNGWEFDLEDYGGEWKTIEYQSDGSDEVNQMLVVHVDTTLEIDIPGHQFTMSTGEAHSVYATTPHRTTHIRLEVDIEPIYAFESSSGSHAGDYYAVSGQITALNGECYSKIVHGNFSGRGEHSYEMLCYYMSSLKVKFELLKDLEGTAIPDIGFAVMPDPSTSIGSVTYKKGYEYTFSYSIGRGYKQQGKGWGVLKRNGLPFFKYSKIDDRIVNLPDQSTTLNTDTSCAISYSFDTRNDDGGWGEEYISMPMRSNQTITFSWIWYVPAGTATGVKDNSDVSFPIRITVPSPTYRSNIHFYGNGQPASLYLHLNEEDHATMPNEGVVWVNLPPVDRRPVGTLQFKNTTRNYVTDIQLFKYDGTLVDDESFLDVSGVYGTAEQMQCLVREGEFNVNYNIKNGDTGEIIRQCVVEHVKITDNTVTSISTLDGKARQ